MLLIRDLGGGPPLLYYSCFNPFSKTLFLLYNLNIDSDELINGIGGRYYRRLDEDIALLLLLQSYPDGCISVWNPGPLLEWL